MQLLYVRRLPEPSSIARYQHCCCGQASSRQRLQEQDCNKPWLKESPACCSPSPAANHLVLPGGRGNGFIADKDLLNVLLVAGPDSPAGGVPCSIRSLHGKITLLLQVTATDPWHCPAYRVPAYETAQVSCCQNNIKTHLSHTFSTFCQNPGHKVQMLEEDCCRHNR